MTIEPVEPDDMPSWVLQPLPHHIGEAIDLLEAAIDLGGHVPTINSAIVYLQSEQGPPSDTEWLGAMGICEIEC